MRRLATFLVVLLISYLGFVTYSNRALLFSRFDEVYWKDKYEQSQWSLPLSQRTIGDDGLYLYEGHRLIRGGDPTSSNAEMPPLGKYLIGICIRVFGSGYIYGLITTLALVVSTYILAKLVLKQTIPALIITVLLATDPLITNQYALTMMDSLQAALLLLFLIILFHIPAQAKKRSTALTLLAGILLGLFSVTKLPVLTPVIALAGLWYLWKKTKGIPFVAIFVIGGLIGYLTPFTVYFLHGHTLVDWLKIQKWVISFYRHSNLTPTWGSAITTLLIGKYQNIFSRMWETAKEWSPSWAPLLFASIAAFWHWIRGPRKNIRWGILFALLFATLGLYAVIPFWTRYLVILLPLFYIIAGGLILSRLPQRLIMMLSAVLLAVNLFSSVPILFSSPQATIDQFIYNTEHMFFADVYEDTSQQNRTIDRDTFRRFAMNTLADAQIEFINIEQKTLPVNIRTSPQYVDMTFTYYTRSLGRFTERVTVPFILEDNRWRIPWQWSFLLPGLTDTTRVETVLTPARRGSIIGSDKKPLTEDINGYMVWITPGNIDKNEEASLLSLLTSVFDGRLLEVAIHQRIVGNTLPDRPIPIGAIPHPTQDPNVIALSRFSGVTLTPALVRVTYPSTTVQIGRLENRDYAECCTWLYSTTSYDGTNGVEQTKNDVLKGINGGSLTLKDRQGNTIRTFITVAGHDGKNVEP